MKIIALVIAVDGCRIIDFVLSNLVNSRISTICVVAQHEPQSLIRHVDTVWGALGAGRRHRPDVVAVFVAYGRPIHCGHNSSPGL